MKFLQANQVYLEHTQEVNTWSKYPQKHLAIVSCMDTRLVELLEPALGIRRGEVKMIKTAGNTITSKFDDVISQFVSLHLSILISRKLWLWSLWLWYGNSYFKRID